MSPEPTVLAYLAGVIDSDGYITIHRSCRKGVLYHAPQVGIAGTRAQPHQLAASIWGGNVNRYEPKNPRHRAQFQWVRYGVAAVEVIAAIAPFLRVKTEQAALAMELGEHLLFGQGDDPYPWFSPDYDPVPGREAMRAEAVRLNQSRSRLRDEFPAEVAR